MQTTTLTTVFTLLIGLSNADLTQLFRPGSEECCKTAYSDNKSSQSVCLSTIENQFKGSQFEKVMENTIVEGTNNAVNTRKEELCKKDENEKRFRQLSDPEDVERLKNEIYETNKEDIKAAEEAFKVHMDSEIKNSMETICDLVLKDITPEMKSEFSAEMFGMILATGMGKFEENDWSQFVIYLKENKEDREQLKTLGVDFWQKLFTLDENLTNFLGTCNCKNTIFTEGFENFVNWIFEQNSRDSSFKLCSMKKVLEMYLQHQEIIKDPNGNRDEIVAKMKTC